MKFQEWRRHDPNNFARSQEELVESYKAYVQAFSKRYEENFFNEHCNEEWFKQKYDYHHLIAHREARLNTLLTSKKSIFDSLNKINDAPDDDFLVKEVEKVFPNLDCPKKLLEKIHNGGNSYHPQSQKPTEDDESEELLVVGEHFDRKLVVFVPKINTKINNDDVASAIKDFLSDGVHEEACESFEVVFNDPCTTMAKIENEAFERAAWIVFENEETAKKLIAQKTLRVEFHVPLSEKELDKLKREHAEQQEEMKRKDDSDLDEQKKEGTPEAEAVPISKFKVEEAEVRVLPQKYLMNKVVNLSVSNPERIRYDLLKAYKFCSLLDKQELKSLTDMLTKKKEEEAAKIENEPIEEDQKHVESKPAEIQNAVIPQVANEGIEDVLKHPAVKKYVEIRQESADLSQIEDGDAQPTEDVVMKLKSFTSDKAKLDVILGYLRRVHLVCYYSGTQFRDVGDLISDSFIPRVRNILSPKVLIEKLKNFTELTEDVVESKKWKSRFLVYLDDRLDDLILQASEEANKKRSDQRSKDKERNDELQAKAVEKFCDEHITSEGENKFRCTLPPNKLFRGRKFVVKHILTKHKELVQEVEDAAMKQLMKEIYDRDFHKPLKSVEQLVQEGLGKPFHQNFNPNVVNDEYNIANENFDFESRRSFSGALSGPGVNYGGYNQNFIPKFQQMPMMGQGLNIPGLNVNFNRNKKEIVIEVPAAKARTVVDYSDL